MVSLATTDSLLKGCQDLEEQLGKLEKQAGTLAATILAAGGGPWAGRPDLQEAALLNWMEERDVEVEELKSRASTRQIELEQMRDLAPGSQPGGPRRVCQLQKPVCGETGRGTPKLEETSGGSCPPISRTEVTTGAGRH